MNNISRKSLIGTFACAAMLSAPLVFAQDAATEQTDPQTTTEQATSADIATASDTTATASDTSVTSDTSATAAAENSGQLRWSDVDTDKDGNLTATEAAVVPALSQVFVEADANADGMLSADEYRAYAAAQGTAEAEADIDDTDTDTTEGGE